MVDLAVNDVNKTNCGVKLETLPVENSIRESKKYTECNRWSPDHSGRSAKCPLQTSLTNNSFPFDSATAS